MMTSDVGAPPNPVKYLVGFQVWEGFVWKEVSKSEYENYTGYRMKVEVKESKNGW